MDNFLEVILTADFLFSVIRVTTPILFAAMGALISNKAGVPNIGLEGIMLMSALMGVLGSAYSQSAFIGLLFAMTTGLLMAMVLGYFTLKLKTHVILGGIALNLFADGASVLLLFIFTGDKGTSSSLASKVMPNIDIPIIKDIPVIGEVVSGHNLLTYVAIFTVIAMWYMLKYTPLGLRIRSVGENSHAAESVGVNVFRTQFTAIAISGVLAALGGAFLSMGYVSWFSRGMVAGRGWIALAAEAMGMGTVIGTALTSLLFGTADALTNSLQLLGIPAELITIVPYVATVIGLVIFAMKETKKAKKKKMSSQ